MPPKAPPSRQPRRGVRGQPTADIQATSGFPAEDIVEEKDQDFSVNQSLVSNVSSPGLADPDQAAQASDPPQASSRLKRNLSAFEASTEAGFDGSAPKTSLKFQPRSNVTRRTKNELEAQKKLEEQRRLERIAEAERNQANSSPMDRSAGPNNSRGRGYAGRGRGSLRGNKVRDGLASGPLGDWRAVPTSRATGRSSKPTNAADEIISPDRDAPPTSSSTTPAVKKEPGVASTTSRPRNPRQKARGRAKDGASASKTKIEDVEIVEISSDEEDADYGSRVNIEDINVDIEEESDDDDPIRVRDRSLRTKTPVKPGWATRPVRVDRSEHVPRSVGVNTDASSAISAELRQRSQEKTGEAGDISGALDTVTASSKGKSKEVEIIGHERRWRGVYEDEEEERPKIKAEPQDEVDVDSARNRPATGQGNGVGQSLEEKAGPSDDVTHPQTRRRKRLSFRIPKGVFQTDADRKEWSRHEQDVKILSEQLSTLHRAPPGYDGDDGTSELPDRLYIFQFPALTPLLAAQPANETITIADPDAALIGATPIPIPRGRESKTPVVKPDPEESTRIPSVLTVDAQLPGGHVGKLRVRKSGRVTLEWGGTSLELGRGAESDILQDAVVIPQDHEEKARATCWALSQIGGKFIVTPDWESIFC